MLTAICVAAIFAVTATGAAGLARAEAHPDPKMRFQGAFWGLQMHTGLVSRLAANAGESPGPTLGLSARLAGYMSILDLQLSVIGSMYDARSTAGEATDVKRLSLGLETHLHPMFMEVLRGTTLARTIGSLYVAIGADLDLTALDGAGLDTTEARFGWHIGGGFDVPLTDPDRGWSLWLGFAYRLKFLSVPTGVAGLQDFDEHTFLVSFAYRNNDIFFARLPRPPEMDHRDPELLDR